MDKEKKLIAKFLLCLATFLLIFFVLTPYFTTDFLDLRQQKENEEKYLKLMEEERAIEAARKDALDKIYLTGKFDPEKREDFVLVPEEFNIGAYKMYLRKEAWDGFLRMAEDAKKDGINLTITSATRNFDYQKNLWNDKWTGVVFVDGKNLLESIPSEFERFQKILEYSAVPGTSRHHWGTDIDINRAKPRFFETEEGLKVYAWLETNAPLFGFCQTYNKKEETRAGYNEEKWHWSFMPISKELTQRYETLIKDEDIKGFLGEEYVPSLNLIKNYVLAINPDCL